MSELKSNKISPALGTTVTLGDSGDTIAIPAGATITNSGTANGFGATDVSSLNDYEEGTWTPVIGGLTSTSGQSYSIQNGYYTKIGRCVTAYFYATLSNKGTISGTLALTGLPFTVANLTNGISAAAITRVEQWTLTSNHVLGLHISANATTGTFTMYDATGAAAGSDILGTANVNNTTSLIGMTTYFTA